MSSAATLFQMSEPSTEFDVPIILVVFNRPEVTARLIRRLASVRPRRLLVIADGSRGARDIEKVKITRSLFDSLPWSCTISRCFSEANLGCAARVSSGLNWAFQLVEEAIILEDDCLPNDSFFPFMKELLERYRYERRVGAICATNLCPSQADPGIDYRFSRYCFIWGWATWRRAWASYDHEMSVLPGGGLNAVLAETLKCRRAELYWNMIFSRTFRGKINSWAYRWQLACWVNGLLSVVPRVNLVDNLGFSEASSHTTDNRYRINAATEVGFPLRHPHEIVADRGADTLVENKVFSRDISNRLKWCGDRLRAKTLKLLKLDAPASRS